MCDPCLNVVSPQNRYQAAAAESLALERELEEQADHPHTTGSSFARGVVYASNGAGEAGYSAPPRLAASGAEPRNMYGVAPVSGTSGEVVVSGADSSSQGYDLAAYRQRLHELSLALGEAEARVAIAEQRVCVSITMPSG